MSNLLGPGTTLELVEALRSAISDISARSEKLTADFRTRIARERLRHQAIAAEHEKSRQAALMGLRSAHETARVDLDKRFEARKRWIDKAFQTSKEHRLKRIDDKVAARRYEAQKTMLQAEKDRQAGLSAVAAAHKDFQEQLGHEGEELARLEVSAQRVFSGYGTLKRNFLAAYQNVQPEAEGSHEQLLEGLKQRIVVARQELAHSANRVLLSVFRYLPVWIILAVCVALLPYLQRFGFQTFPERTGWIAGAAVLGGAILLRLLGYFQAKPGARRLSQALAEARRLHDLVLEKSEAHHQAELQRVQAAFAATHQSVDQQLRKATTEAGDARVYCRMEADAKTVRATATNKRLHGIRVERLAQDQELALKEENARLEKEGAQLGAAGEQKQKALEKELDDERAKLAAEWSEKLSSINSKLQAHKVASESLFLPWNKVPISTWTAPKTFCGAAKFGDLAVDVTRLGPELPKDKRLVMSVPPNLALPLTLVYPEEGSLLLESSGTGSSEAIAALNDVILRLLATTPPGRLAFTILDPVGLGQNFAGVMHMADYEEQIIHNRIWTQPGQIEQRLADLNEHMEKVIQMYLRNEYATIAEYNKQAGVIAEKYHFLVIADFPAGFTDVAAKRLASIAASGARCGVYMLIHWDRRIPLPQDFIPDELRKSAFCLTLGGPQPLVASKSRPGINIQLEVPPPPDVATEFVHRIGQQSRDSSRVEVPFEHVAPPPDKLWSEETTTELLVPIGRTGATKLQYLAIGKGTCQHALVAGKTGSGKSTLFHVIITNLALWCSPEQVEFYLVDFKKGVEFKPYATHRLPHARVVAIESDREFGLSVLQRVDDELRRRGDLFRQLGVQDLPGYKRAGGGEPMPRCLLLIDEFQEFFVEDDRVSQTASMLLDRIVRQGRAFGIHVVLGSQTLGGAYTVARTTLGQMVIRIALQCNEADAYLIMDDTNPAPRLLSRPGEGIYNDTAGSLEGNSPFQVVWLPESVRDRALDAVEKKAEQSGGHYPGPIVFEGNSPANVRENPLFMELLEHGPAALPRAGRMWLGAPNSIKGPTEVVFHRQSGNNLLIIGQREEAILAMLGLGLVALAAQYPPGTARFIFCDSTPPGTSQSEFLERIFKALPHSLRIARPGDLPEVMAGFGTEMRERTELADPAHAPATFLFINGLQRFSRLRYEEDFSFSADESAAANPAAILNSLVTEGTRLGFHTVIACDTYNNVNRYLSRKAQSEFELRVLFQMSATDSASLIDNPKASMLGLHRAVYHNAQEGTLETFRPYALPDLNWLELAAQKLAMHNATGASAVRAG